MIFFHHDHFYVSIPSSVFETLIAGNDNDDDQKRKKKKKENKSEINSGVISRGRNINRQYVCFAVRTDSITCGQFYGVYEYRDIPTAA